MHRVATAQGGREGDAAEQTQVVDMRRQAAQWPLRIEQLGAPTWFVDDASDFTGRLGEIRIPTLVLSGDADPLSPVRAGEFLRDRIPSARLRVVAGGTHAMAHDEPDRIAGLIEPLYAAAP